MSKIHAQAALSPNAKLESFTYDSGDLKANEVEVKVLYSGLCHSDLSMLANDWGIASFPFVPGHEAVGTVAAIGKDVQNLKVGQNVGIGWNAESCNACHECLMGEHQMCSRGKGTIVGRHGAFADRIVVHETWARPLPEGLDLATAGPLLCAGVTAFTPFIVHKIPGTASVGVVGIGGLGHLALQFANKWGCEVHAFTTSDGKEDEAKKLGAHFVHNTKKPDALKALAGKLDLIISTINQPQDIAGLLETLRPKGVLHQVGAALQPMEVPAFGLIMGQKSVAGSLTGSPTALDEMLAFSARHKIAPLVESFPMSKINEAFDRLRSGKARYRIVLKND